MNLNSSSSSSALSSETKEYSNAALGDSEESEKQRGQGTSLLFNPLIKDDIDIPIQSPRGRDRNQLSRQSKVLSTSSSSSSVSGILSDSSLAPYHASTSSPAIAITETKRRPISPLRRLIGAAYPRTDKHSAGDNPENSPKSEKASVSPKHNSPSRRKRSSFGSGPQDPPYNPKYDREKGSYDEASPMRYYRHRYGHSRLGDDSDSETDSAMHVPDSEESPRKLREANPYKERGSSERGELREGSSTPLSHSDEEANRHYDEHPESPENSTVKPTEDAMDVYEAEVEEEKKKNDKEKEKWYKPGFIPKWGFDKKDKKDSGSAKSQSPTGSPSTTPGRTPPVTPTGTPSETPRTKGRFSIDPGEAKDRGNDRGQQPHVVGLGVEIPAIPIFKVDSYPDEIVRVRKNSRSPHHRERGIAPLHGSPDTELHKQQPRHRSRAGSLSERAREPSGGARISAPPSSTITISTTIPTPSGATSTNMKKPGVVVGSGGGVVVVLTEGLSEESNRARKPERLAKKPSRTQSEARGAAVIAPTARLSKLSSPTITTSLPPSPSRLPIFIGDSACEKFLAARSPSQFLEKESRKLLGLGSLEEWIEYTVILEADEEYKSRRIIHFLLSHSQYVASTDVLVALASVYTRALQDNKDDKLTSHLIASRALQFVKLWITSLYCWSTSPRVISLFDAFFILVAKDFEEAGTDSDEDALQYSPYHKKRYDRSPRSEILVEEKERSREVGGEEEFTIFSITPLDLAKQLCILDKHNIDKIKEDEFMNLAWTKEGPDSAEMIKRMMACTNNMTYWLIQQILTPTKAKRRAAVIEDIISLGEHLVQLQNFNSLLAVYLALESSYVSRLRKTWKHVSKKMEILRAKVCYIMNPARNFKGYRDKVRQLNVDLDYQKESNLIPCIEIVLKDILFNNEQTIVHGQYNFGMMESIGALINSILHCKYNNYPFLPISAFQQYLMNLEPPTSEELTELSRVREPGK